VTTTAACGRRATGRMNTDLSRQVDSRSATDRATKYSAAGRAPGGSLTEKQRRRGHSLRDFHGARKEHGSASGAGHSAPEIHTRADSHSPYAFCSAFSAPIPNALRSAVLRQPPGGAHQHQHHNHAPTASQEADSPHVDLSAPVAHRPVKGFGVDGDQRGERLVVRVEGVVGLTRLVAGAERYRLGQITACRQLPDLAVVGLVGLVATRTGKSPAVSAAGARSHTSMVTVSDPAATRIVGTVLVGSARWRGRPG